MGGMDCCCPCMYVVHLYSILLMQINVLQHVSFALETWPFDGCSGVVAQAFWVCEVPCSQSFKHCCSGCVGHSG